MSAAIARLQSLGVLRRESRHSSQQVACLPGAIRTRRDVFLQAFEMRTKPVASVCGHFARLRRIHFTFHAFTFSLTNVRA